MLSGKKINEIKYDYGKKNTIYVESPPEEESKLPKEGDILFYKKRGVKEKRLNQINQWKFICVETEGENKGKWKVQGLHRKEGDFCWFDPKMLRNSKEILTDPVKPSNQPMSKKPITYSHEKKLSQVERTKNNRREVIKRLLKDNFSQKNIAERLGISPASVSQHVKIIRLEDELFFDQSSKKEKEEEVPILNLTESAQYLKIGKTRLWDIMKDNGIKPAINGKKKMLTESQIEKISKIIEAQELGNRFAQANQIKKKEPLYNKIFKEDKEQDLATYGIDFPVTTNVIDDEEKTKWVGLPKEHKATIEMKNYNYKRVISENLKLIKSLVHQTNEFLEKIQ